MNIFFETKWIIFFDFFPLHGIKMEKEDLIFGKECIIKNKFHIYKRSVSTDKVDIAEKRLIWK